MKKCGEDTIIYDKNNRNTPTSGTALSNLHFIRYKNKECGKEPFEGAPWIYNEDEENEIHNDSVGYEFKDTDNLTGE